MKRKKIVLVILTVFCLSFFYSSTIDVYGEEGNTQVGIAFRVNKHDDGGKRPKDDVVSPDKSKPVRPEKELIQAGEVTNEFLVVLGFSMVLGVLLFFLFESSKEMEQARKEVS